VMLTLRRLHIYTGARPCQIVGVNSPNYTAASTGKAAVVRLTNLAARTQSMFTSSDAPDRGYDDRRWSALVP
jgi:hypothetical protein